MAIVAPRAAWAQPQFGHVASSATKSLVVRDATFHGLATAGTRMCAPTVGAMAAAPARWPTARIDRGAPFACNVRHVVGLHASNVGGVVTMTAASNASPDGAAVKAGMKRGAKIGAVGMAALTALYIGAGTDEGVGFLIVNTLGAAVAGGVMGALVGAAVGVIR